MNIYCDGSSRPHSTKCGGSAVVVPDLKVVIYSHIPSPSTNNVAELFAVLTAFRFVDTYIDKNPTATGFTIFSDSEYTVKSFNEWIKGEHDIAKRANSDILKELYPYKKKFSKIAKLQWMRGHVDESDETNYNNLADKMANVAVENTYIRELSYNKILFKCHRSDFNVNSLSKLK